MTLKNYYIGIMSGTSLDGIDVVIVDFKNNNTSLVASSTTHYPETIKQHIENLVNAQQSPLSELCKLDRELAKLYAAAVLNLLKSSDIKPEQIHAIGCHGQTIKHDPNGDPAYTLQIGDPSTLSALTNITVVADFRRKDIALGGQGAPLAPAFHQYAFQSQSKNRAIINIGGIGNITLLPSTQTKHDIVGFDTGPGNTLMDHLCLKHFNCSYDKDGELAASGKINHLLLNHIIKCEPYFKQLPPKSTGTDYFNLEWFSAHIAHLDLKIKPIDELATLNELSALAISTSIDTLPLKIDEIYYCGGGQRNTTLTNSLKNLIPCKQSSTESLGIHHDWVEAIAFAWFAKNTLKRKTSNLSSVTSAGKNTILGGIYFS